MSEHKIQISWSRNQSSFEYEKYPRTHTIKFEGGQSLTGSAAMEYFGKSEHANPEEMLAAALSACHMLTFLAIASKSRLVVDQYEDHAVATLGKNSSGKMAITEVTLHPRITFAPESTAPSKEKINEIHNKAHNNCFIANSVTCPVHVAIP